MSLSRLDKDALLAAVLAELRARIDQRTRLAKETAEGATHEEARAENDKDTRALEATYLARGQAERVAAAQTELLRLEHLSVEDFSEDRPVGVTALAKIEDEQERVRILFLLPAGGGMTLATEVGEVQVVSPASPLGRGILGRTADDDFFINIRGRRQDWTIIETR